MVTGRVAYLLTRMPKDGPLQLLHGTGHLVTQSGLALLVNDLLATTEETAL
jgi:hypothetical protein